MLNFITAFAAVALLAAGTPDRAASRDQLVAGLAPADEISPLMDSLGRRMEALEGRRPSKLDDGGLRVAIDSEAAELQAVLVRLKPGMQAAETATGLRGAAASVDAFDASLKKLREKSGGKQGGTAPSQTKIIIMTFADTKAKAGEVMGKRDALVAALVRGR